MHTSLWTKISNFPLDSPDAPLPFSKKLAKQNGWSSAFTHSAIEEYKRFVYLCVVESQPMTPSKIVDSVWHLHLTYTRNYWEELCRDVLERPLHHNPSDGTPSDDDKYKAAYQRTLLSYTKHFGQAAPSKIWGPIKRKTTSQSPAKQVSLVAGLLILGYLCASQINTSTLINVKMASFEVFFVIIVAIIVLGLIFGKGGSRGGGGSHGGCDSDSGCGGGCGGD